MITRPFLRFRFVTAAALVYSLFSLNTPSAFEPWGPGILLALLGVWAIRSVAKPYRGNLARRRLLEAGVCGLAAIDFVARGAGRVEIHYAAFPLFLVFVYGGYQWRHLALLLPVEGAFLLTGRAGSTGSIDGREVLRLYLFLIVWTVLAKAFRTVEHQKRQGVVDRLSVYEREASALSGGSAEVEELLRMDEKKDTHLRSMIREREQTFRRLLEILQKTFEPHTCALYLFDPQEEVFLLKDYLTESDRFSERRIQPPDGIFRVLLREQAPVRLVSASGVRGLTYYDGTATVKAALAVPLRSDQSLKGVVLVDRLSANAFTEEETETIEQVAHEMIRAIENAEALHAYHHLKEEFSSFYAASTALNRSLRVEDVVHTLLDSTRKIVEYDWGAVILYDRSAESNTIVQEQGVGTQGWEEKSFACAPERGLVSWVIKNQTPLFYTHFRSREGKAPLFPKQLKVPHRYDSVAILPIEVKGEPLGAVLFAAEANFKFSKSARRMLEVVALQAAASLKNARMVGELSRLATTDGLTGLMNHRTFQETLASELERSIRHPSAISLLLVDIDFFKKFNDEYGHPLGDLVLREVSGVLRKTLRKVDSVARYGGEEFAVVLVNTPVSGAEHMAQRIVSEVAKSRFVQGGHTFRVTISVGTATFPDLATSREELIERADRALYESKRKGRNRATTYSASLGKMEKEVSERKLINAMEDEVRHMAEEIPVSDSFA